MPTHLVLSDILLKFQVRLHQLTRNTIGQLSKYIWLMASFCGVLSFLILIPNRIFIGCVARNQVYTHNTENRYRITNVTI
jgi:hypothetical protein